MDHPEIRALLIEDDPGCAALVRRSLTTLSSSSHRMDLERTATLQEGMDRLGKGDVDVLLLDLKLPDSQGIDTVVRVRECDSEIPIVVLTATGDEETAVGALKAGAQDYLVKTELTGSLLSRATRYAIERQREKKEREQLRQHLFQVQKRESLGVLAGGVTWGIDRELGLILDCVDVALDELTSSSRPGRVAISLKEIFKAALRAAKLTSWMKTYAKAGQPSPRPIDMSVIILDASDFLDSMIPQEIDVSYDLPPGLPAVEGDETQIRQVVTNLIANACEAIGAGRGAIRVRTGAIWADRSLLDSTYSDHALPEGEYVLLEVHDTGPAIPPEMMAKIFDPFFTTKRAGRGLGLAATLGLVRGHGGALKVESAGRRGTTFTVLIPARRRSQHARNERRSE